MIRKAAFIAIVTALLTSCGSNPTSPTLAKVLMSPTSGTVAVGATLQLSATALDDAGQTMTGATFSWSSTDPSVASVNSSGLVTGVAAGTTTIKATAEGVSGTATITVEQIPVATVEVSPAAAQVFTGATTQLTAVAKDLHGNVLAGRAITWSSGDESVATVNSSGLVTGVTVGSASITATSEGKSGTATVTVAAKTATSLVIEPDTVTIWRGQVLQLSAVGKADDGTEMSVAGVTWSSSDGTTLYTWSDSLGLFIGMQAGTATVTATNGTLSTTGTVTVLPHLMGQRFQTIAAGDTHTCGILTGFGVDGVIACWGDGSRWALAQSDTAEHDTPVQIPTPSSEVTSLAAGAHFTCTFPGASLTGTASYCWGEGTEGQLGNGTETDTNTPTAIPMATILDQFIALDASDGHACAIDVWGHVYCWGQDPVSTTDTPTQAFGDLKAGNVAVGADHTCVVAIDGAVWCRGKNDHGQLGDGTTTASTSGVAVQGSHTFVSLAAGTSHTCGVDDAGAAWCWGAGSGLGDGVGTDVSTPVAVAGGLTFLALSAGNGYTCGVTSGHQLYCWGNNGSGQLGDGTTTSQATPTLVSGGLSWSVVSAGSAHTCAITTDHLAYCWGSGANGRLGTGNTADRTTPTAVAGGLKFANDEAAKAPPRGG